MVLYGFVVCSCVVLGGVCGVVEWCCSVVLLCCVVWNGFLEIVSKSLTRWRQDCLCPACSWTTVSCYGSCTIDICLLACSYR